jgi:hypothetical protein
MRLGEKVDLHDSMQRFVKVFFFLLLEGPGGRGCSLPDEENGVFWIQFLRRRQPSDDSVVPNVQKRTVQDDSDSDNDEENPSS